MKFVASSNAAENPRKEFPIIKMTFVPPLRFALADFTRDEVQNKAGNVFVTSVVMLTGSAKNVGRKNGY